MPKPQYGAKHQQARRMYQAIVDTGLAKCCLCNKRLDPSLPWDLDHVPGTSEYRGPACRGCNRSEGAARGNRTRSKTKQRKWTL